MDTGAGKSLVRDDVAAELGLDERTQNHCSKAVPIGKALNCEGAEKGRVIGRIEWSMLIRFIFESLPTDKTPDASTVRSPALQDLRVVRADKIAKFVAKCYVMPKLSDPIILGIPELRALGIYLEPPDASGRKWVQFTTLGVRLPLLDPKQRISPLMTDDRKLVSGPEFRPVTVSLSRADYQVAVE